MVVGWDLESTRGHQPEVKTEANALQTSVVKNQSQFSNVAKRYTSMFHQDKAVNLDI